MIKILKAIQFGFGSPALALLLVNVILKEPGLVKQSINKSTGLESSKQI